VHALVGDAQLRGLSCGFPAQMADDQHHQHQHDTADGIAAPGVLLRQGHRRQRFGLADAHAHNQGIVFQAMPGVVALYTVDGGRDQVLAVRLLRPLQEVAVLGHGLAQYLIDEVRACDVAAVVAHNQRCVLRVGVDL